MDRQTVLVVLGVAAACVVALRLASSYGGCCGGDGGCCGGDGGGREGMGSRGGGGGGGGGGRGAWSEWSACSVECGGGGTQTRLRLPGGIETRQCGDGPCPPPLPPPTGKYSFGTIGSDRVEACARGYRPIRSLADCAEAKAGGLWRTGSDWFDTGTGDRDLKSCGSRCDSKAMPKGCWVSTKRALETKGRGVWGFNSDRGVTATGAGAWLPTTRQICVRDA